VLSGLSRDAYSPGRAVAALERSLRGHIPRGVTALEAVEARQNSLEHLFGVQAGLLSEGGDLDERKDGRAVRKNPRWWGRAIRRRCCCGAAWSPRRRGA